MNQKNDEYDVIVLGAGPAGLVAAAGAVRRGARALILDKAAKAGRKLLISGGGKGNVTNLSVTCNDYVGEDPEFAASALKRCTPEMFLARLRKSGIAVEEREEGRIFCRRSAKDVLDMLTSSLANARCAQKYQTHISGIRHSAGRFLLYTDKGNFCARRLVLATGSPAWPQCGADASGLELARSLGHRIIAPRPVLAPFVLPPASPLRGLAGISVQATVNCALPDTPSFTEPLLFTHQGISGPAILQISCYWRPGADLRIDFLPQGDLRALLDGAKGKATPLSILNRHLPDRLSRALLPEDLSARRAAELSKAHRQMVADAVHAHIVQPLRSEGMGRAEAAAGGVATAEVNPQRLESLLLPGLFFCGEVLDITGRLGGYNLHWAWASGAVAGESL